MGKSHSKRSNGADASSAAPAPPPSESTSLTSANKARPRRANDTERLRRELSVRSRARARELGSSSQVEEVNLFFVPVPGCDVHEFVERFAQSTGYTVMHCAREHERAYTQIEELRRAHYHTQLWDNPTAAVADLLAASSANVLLHLPSVEEHGGGGGGGGGGNGGHAAHVPQRRGHGPAVRLFERSPVEDRNITLPLLLDKRIDGPTYTLLNGAINAAWHTLQAHVKVNCSVWVYLRIVDDKWEQRLMEMGRINELDACIRQRLAMARKRLDEFFLNDNFTYRQHTLMVNVHNNMLGVDDVVHDVIEAITSFVTQQIQANCFSSATDPDTLYAHLQTAEYRRRRIVEAVHARTMQKSSEVGSGGGGGAGGSSDGGIRMTLASSGSGTTLHLATLSHQHVPTASLSAPGQGSTTLAHRAVSRTTSATLPRVDPDVRKQRAGSMIVRPTYDKDEEQQQQQQRHHHHYTYGSVESSSGTALHSIGL